MGLKLLQKGQHKTDKYGVKVSGVTREGVPQHLVGLNLQALNGEAVDNITHAEVMAKLKAAGRPLTLQFNGTMAADLAAKAGLLSTNRIDASPASSPALKPAASPASFAALGAPTAEQAAAKLAANAPSATLVKVSTEHTWSEAGPMGLKLLQKGQHKTDKYGVKVSGVTREGVPQHLVGLNLQALNGEAVDNITHAEVMAKLKAAGRPLTLRFIGTMAADLAAKAGLVSAPSSPTTNATAVSGGPAAAPLTSPALPAFNFGGAASPSGSSAFNFGGSVPAAAAPAPAAPGFQFNFDSSTAAAAAGADAPKFQFNFTPSAAGDDDDEDDDEDDEESDEDFDFDEMDFDGLMGDDDKWLFTAEDVDVDDIREGFGLDDTAVVVKLNANKTSSLDEVTKVLQQQ